MTPKKAAAPERPIASSIPSAPTFYRASTTPERAAVAFFRHDHLKSDRINVAEPNQIWDAVPIVVNAPLTGARTILRYLSENGDFHCCESQYAAEIALGLCAQRDPRVIDMLESRIELKPYSLTNALSHTGKLALAALMRLLDHDSRTVSIAAAAAINHLGEYARPAFPKLLQLFLRRPDVTASGYADLSHIIQEVAREWDTPADFVADAPIPEIDAPSPENETSPREAATSHGPRATTT